MKKLLSLFICLMLLITFTSCQNTSKNEKKKEEVKVQETKKEEKKKTAENPKKEENTTSSANENKETNNNVSANAKVICIDAGHQARGNNALEANGPGSSIKKAKVTSGTTGVSTKKAESLLNLEIALKLQTELTKRGYKVVMVRTSQDVNISNIERAQIANNANADANIRLHADGSENRNINGYSILTPSSNNKYLSSDIVSKSYNLSKAICSSYGSSTGFKNNGVRYRDDLTGTNWSKVPTTLVEMGYMSNPSEDVKLSNSTYQNKIVIGIANGIDAYFNA